ncbi:MAG: hypothetical protein LRY74_18825 [Shewanella xiamenensis]|nr:hypothetical protein [Shewanella xiamenensis]
MTLKLSLLLPMTFAVPVAATERALHLKMCLALIVTLYRLISCRQGAVNVVVGGGRSRCHANDIFIIEDDSANDNPTLEHLKFLVVAGGLNFNVSASVHSQLKEHPEFKQQKSMVEYQNI